MTTDTSAPILGEQELADRLTTMIRSQTKDEVQVADLHRTSSGLSRENWTFTATWPAADGRAAQPMILRRDPAGSLLDTDRAVELAVLRALASTRVPAPAVHWVDPDGRWLGSPSLVMELVAGDCDWFVLNGERPLEARLDLARSFLALLTEIQAVDWRGTGLDAVLPDPGPHAARAEIDHWEGELRRVQLEPMPEMEIVIGWLRATASPSARTVLVHGDFKPGNALLQGDTISAMLDWETAHLGDPLEDLGWITNPVRRSEHQIAGRWERADIVAAFEERTGLTVDDAELRWWNVFSCWKLAIIVLTGLHAFSEERYDRVHHYPGWLYRTMFALMGEDG